MRFKEPRQLSAQKSKIFELKKVKPAYRFQKMQKKNLFLHFFGTRRQFADPRPFPELAKKAVPYQLNFQSFLKLSRGRPISLCEIEYFSAQSAENVRFFEKSKIFQKSILDFTAGGRSRQ